MDSKILDFAKKEETKGTPAVMVNPFRFTEVLLKDITSNIESFREACVSTIIKNESNDAKQVVDDFSKETLAPLIIGLQACAQYLKNVKASKSGVAYGDEPFKHMANLIMAMDTEFTQFCKERGVTQ